MTHAASGHFTWMHLLTLPLQFAIVLRECMFNCIYNVVYSFMEPGFFLVKTLLFVFAQNSFLKSKTNFKHRHRLWWFFWSHFCNLCFDTDKFYFITNSSIWIVLKILGTHLSSFYEFCVTFRWKKSSIKHSNWAVWWSGMIS